MHYFLVFVFVHGCTVSFTKELYSQVFLCECTVAVLRGQVELVKKRRN